MEDQTTKSEPNPSTPFPLRTVRCGTTVFPLARAAREAPTLASLAPLLVLPWPSPPLMAVAAPGRRRWRAKSARPDVPPTRGERRQAGVAVDLFGVAAGGEERMVRRSTDAGSTWRCWWAAVSWERLVVVGGGGPSGHGGGGSRPGRPRRRRREMLRWAGRSLPTVDEVGAAGGVGEGEGVGVDWI